MAVPKRRTSCSRKKMRRSHHGLTAMQVHFCGQCEQPILPHRICSNCGYYKGREVVKVATSEK
jgi:large subunit ribosomal protein L32